MFERIISSILTRLLGEYVEGSSFNTESVKLGIWRGGQRMGECFHSELFARRYVTVPGRHRGSQEHGVRPFYPAQLFLRRISAALSCRGLAGRLKQQCIYALEGRG